MNRIAVFTRLTGVCLTFLAVIALPAAGQWEARFGLPPVNPNSGLEMNPRVIYDPVSGVVSLDNVGDNGVVDSIPDGNGPFPPLLGDDVGMISVVMTMRPENASATPLLPVFANGVAWSPPIYFDGLMQLQGNAISENFLPIQEGPTELFQLPTGLSEDDFVGDSGLIEIEMGINHTVALPGITLFTVGDPLESGAFAISRVPGTQGDFNGDQRWDCSDVDQLVFEIAGGTNNVDFDLTDDMLVDSDDLDAWLTEAGFANLGAGESYLPGDANLDGEVDASDFNIWNGSKLTATPAWCSGDFNADGFVDVSDFNSWNGNKFRSSLDVVAVPEPSDAVYLFPLLTGSLVTLRKSQQKGLSR